MSEEIKDPDNLDMYFSAARQARPEPSDALLRRIAQDAALLHPKGRAAPLRMRWCFDEIGGWRGLATLAASAILGVWLGIGTVDPASLPIFSAPVADLTNMEDPFFPFVSEG